MKLPLRGTAYAAVLAATRRSWAQYLSLGLSRATHVDLVQPDSLALFVLAAQYQYRADLQCDEDAR